MNVYLDANKVLQGFRAAYDSGHKNIVQASISKAKDLNRFEYLDSAKIDKRRGRTWLRSEAWDHPRFGLRSAMCRALLVV